MEALWHFLNRLNPISAATWRQVQPLFTPLFLNKGDYFIRQAQVAATIGFLQEGVIRAYYKTHGGVEYNKHFFVPGSFAGGYASLISGRPGHINQQALTPCHLLTASYKKITGLYNQCPDLERAARKLTELFFIDKEEREIELVLLNAEQRYMLFQKRYPGLEQQIAQYHIASFLGVTPTQLSRIRRKLARK